MWYTYLLVGILAAGIAAAVTGWLFSRRRQAIPVVLIGTITESGADGAGWWKITMHIDEAFVTKGSAQQHPAVPRPGAIHTFRVSMDKISDFGALRRAAGTRVVLAGRELLYADQRPMELSVHGLRPVD